MDERSACGRPSLPSCDGEEFEELEIEDYSLEASHEEGCDFEEELADGIRAFALARRCVSDATEEDTCSVTDGGGSLPFYRLYEPPIPMNEQSEYFYVPGVPVTVALLRVERDNRSSHIMHPNLYVLEISHGDFKWVIKKRYKHFLELHTTLRLYRASMAVPLPSRSHQRQRRSFAEAATKRKPLPRFPKRPDSMLSFEQVQHRSQLLVSYLTNLLAVPGYRHHPKTVEFLEISPLSFLSSTGPKGKEGLVSKRSGGQTGHSCFIHMRLLWFKCCSRWKRRWLIARDTYVLSLHPQTGSLRAVLLMDKEFRVYGGLRSTGSSSGLLMSNLSRTLLVDVWTKRREREWTAHVEHLMRTRARDFVNDNRFDSFAPARGHTYARW